MNSAPASAITVGRTLSPFPPATSYATRIESIDLLRGIVIILMTLDHVRDYFHADAFLYNPTDLSATTPGVFMTRWITHFCAPVFVFLAGTSAFLVGQRKGPDALSSFLVKRGLWLVFLEFTVMNLAWFFNLAFPLFVFQVIGALGVGMILLSMISRLPHRLIMVASITIIAGHNLLDSIHIEGNGMLAILWSWLHEFRGFAVGDRMLLLGYPILPWTAIMMLGFSMGKIYVHEFSPGKRKSILINAGMLMILSFILIRLLNIYGDPVRWTTQESTLFTILSFINVTKYPPSLLYVLITLGPAFVVLGLLENKTVPLSKYILALGRAPMLYYIMHIYFIHVLAVVAALITGFEFTDMVFNTWVTDSPNLKGYGFSLPVTYLLWIVVVVCLLPLCYHYDRYKRARKDKWWLSYL